MKPLYDELHCYARARLAKQYGEDKVPAGKPIPAQLLGNMWAQQWNKIYDDMLKPYPAASIETADAQLKAQKWDAVRMTRSAETLLHLARLPAAAADVLGALDARRGRATARWCATRAPGTWSTRTDVRIKMCIAPTEEDLYTIYHELGHVYYYLSYASQPYLFRDGANDGFHEAIGDTVNLSVTPAYLAKIGLIAAR